MYVYMYMYMYVPWCYWFVFGQRERLGSLMLLPQYLQKKRGGGRERPHSQESWLHVYNIVMHTIQQQ